MKSFREIVAWQRAMRLASMVYEYAATLPENERFGLGAQIRRAAVSIPSNIAEGFGRQTRMDFLRFLRTARGSLYELQTQVELAQALGMVDRNQELEAMASETDRVLQGFIRGLEDSPPRDGQTDRTSA